MADGNGGGNSALSLIVGALIVLVLIGGFFMYTGGHFGGAAPSHSVNLNVTTPSHPF